MAITANSGNFHIHEISADLIADTAAEVDADLESLAGKYVQIADQGNQFFYIEDCGHGRFERKTAYDYGVYRQQALALAALYGVPVFIQDTDPADDGIVGLNKYIWVQTNYQEAGDFTLWFEDGE